MEFVEATGSLDPTKETTFGNQETFYYINFSKLSNVNDLVLVLSSMGFGISDRNPGFEQIKQFLDLDKPVRLK
jgi:hypothetical protein